MGEKPVFIVLDGAVLDAQKQSIELDKACKRPWCPDQDVDLLVSEVYHLLGVVGLLSRKKVDKDPELHSAA